MSGGAQLPFAVPYDFGSFAGLLNVPYALPQKD